MELLEEFNNLSQGDSLEEYNERFGELRLWLLSINPYLPMSYFVWCYLKGLKLNTKSLVQLGRPKELEEAMKLAALHNKSIPKTQELEELVSQTSPIEMEIPNPTSMAIDVLGEGQTIRESADRGLMMLADGVLGDSEPELAEEEATELAQAKEITTLPNDRNQESDENLVKQGTWFKTSKVTSELSYTVESALDQELESALEKVAKDDEIGVGNENPFGTGEILKKFTEFGVVSIGFLRIPGEYQVFSDLSDEGSAILKKIGKFFESFAVAYNVFDKMPWEDMLALSMEYNGYLVVFDPGGWQRGELSIQGSYNIIISIEGDKRQREAIDSKMMLDTNLNLDPGGMCCLQSAETDMLSKYYNARELMRCRNLNLKFIRNGPETLPFDRGADIKSGNAHGIPSCILIFDPGGELLENTYCYHSFAVATVSVCMVNCLR